MSVFMLLGAVGFANLSAPNNKTSRPRRQHGATRGIVVIPQHTETMDETILHIL